MDLLSLFRALASLAVVLGLVGAVAYGARRWGPAGLLQARPATQRRMSVIESLTLGAQTRLVLVRVDAEERLVLVGSAQLLNGPKRSGSAGLL